MYCIYFQYKMKSVILLLDQQITSTFFFALSVVLHATVSPLLSLPAPTQTK